jgi:hypothetical protein
MLYRDAKSIASLTMFGYSLAVMRTPKEMLKAHLYYRQKGEMTKGITVLPDIHTQNIRLISDNVT